MLDAIENMPLQSYGLYHPARAGLHVYTWTKTMQVCIFLGNMTFSTLKTAQSRDKGPGCMCHGISSHTQWF